MRIPVRSKFAPLFVFILLSYFIMSLHVKTRISQSKSGNTNEDRSSHDRHDYPSLNQVMSDLYEKTNVLLIDSDRREKTSSSQISSDRRENTSTSQITSDRRENISASQITSDRRENTSASQSTSDHREKTNNSQVMNDRRDKTNDSQISWDRHDKTNLIQIMSDHGVKTNVGQILKDGREKIDARQTASDGHHVQPDIRQTTCNGCFPHNFDFLINNKNICSTRYSDTDIDLFIMIFTRHENFETRQAIRETWLTIAKNNTSNVRYVFLLGKVENEQLSDKIARETELHKDIIKEDFIDSYRNQTIKTIMGFKWVAKYCRVAKFVMKADDDTFVNIQNLLTYLHTSGKNQSTRMIGSCRIDGPIRDLTSKWYTTEQEYKERLYPWHCSGTGYLTSFKMAEKIYEVSPDVPFFWLEDIYISLCFMVIGGEVKHLSGFNRLRVKLDPCIYKGKHIYTSHEVTPNMLRKVWNEKCKVKGV